MENILMRDASVKESFKSYVLSWAKTIEYGSFSMDVSL